MASLVGGASVITFPVMLAIGLSPVVATASNLVAVSAGNFLAAMTDRGQLPPFNRAFVGLLTASVLGALIGAMLLLATPGAAVRVADPAAARLCHRAVRLCRAHHAAWLRARARRAAAANAQIERDQHPAGAADLDLWRLFRRRRRHAAARRADRSRPRATIARANVAKNLVSSLNTFAASIWFIANGAVSWPQTLVMMAGCLIGGLLRRPHGAPSFRRTRCGSWWSWSAPR